MTTDELISQMAAVLKFGDSWKARAFGRDSFAGGKTPRQAMERALGLEAMAENHWAGRIVQGAALPSTVTPVPVDLNPNSDLF